jgi:hypothetical protein
MAIEDPIVEHGVEGSQHWGKHVLHNTLHLLVAVVAKLEDGAEELPSFEACKATCG